MADEHGVQRLRESLAGHCKSTELLAGTSGLEQVAASSEVDFVMAGIVGAAGLLPSLAAARAGKRVLLANKEALVMSGRLFIDAARANGAELLPIDSEHNAIFQCMPPEHRGGLDGAGIRRILLTASGGPFRQASPSDLAAVTPEQACAHPNWVMGRKISVDSATMMNKGLEVIEACWLFDTTPERLQVLIHPQSIVHSMVEYDDGSVLAQLGNPDMRTPIAHALSWPERMHSGVDSLDLAAIGGLVFEAPDMQRFPCLRLGFEAAAAGGAASATLNAANEIAVQAFLERRIRFVDIPRLLESALEQHPGGEPQSLEEVLAIDAAARRAAGEQVARLAA
jgi:1-deoxy-D-xylulose-5-phosphate reductoisomerase